MAENMSLPARRDARFHYNISSVETGNEGKRNWKRIRFHQKSSAKQAKTGNPWKRTSGTLGNESFIFMAVGFHGFDFFQRPWQWNGIFGAGEGHR
jgi:hypothetical protein